MVAVAALRIAALTSAGCALLCLVFSFLLIPRYHHWPMITTVLMVLFLALSFLLWGSSGFALRNAEWEAREREARLRDQSSKRS